MLFTSSETVASFIEVLAQNGTDYSLEVIQNEKERQKNS